MILLPPSAQPRQREDDGSSPTKTFTMHLDSVVLSVSCNRPSTTAVENFTNTLHEILLNLLDDSSEAKNETEVSPQ